MKILGTALLASLVLVGCSESVDRPAWQVENEMIYSNGFCLQRNSFVDSYRYSDGYLTAFVCHDGFVTGVPVKVRRRPSSD